MTISFTCQTELINSILLSGGNLIARNRLKTTSVSLKFQRTSDYSSLISLLEIQLKKYKYKTSTSTVRKNRDSTVLYVNVDERLKEIYDKWYKITGISNSGIVVLNYKKIPDDINICHNTLAIWYAASGNPHIIKWNTKSQKKSKLCGGNLYYPGGSLDDGNLLIDKLKQLNLKAKCKLAHKNGKYGDYYYLNMDLDNFTNCVDLIKPKLTKALAFKLNINAMSTI